jgi:ARG/rhodanese/phosphatase superfamily protein
MRSSLLAAAALAALSSCARHAPQSTATQPTAPAMEVASANVAPPAAPLPAAQGAPAMLKGDHVVGAGRALDNLTVFPITSKNQVDVGPVRTLDDALAKHEAEVREMGATGGDGPAQQLNRAQFGGGAQVNTLIIENTGTVPIFVLAGTIVKGGQQDRQIGQDFIVGAHKTVPVDAFCVEHGRWTVDRNGVATGGKFGTMQQLAPSSVRAAGQYDQNQSEVWSKVGEVNKANRKEAATGTLMATMDDGEVARKRADLASRVNLVLTAAPSDPVVGFAYAVDGKVRGARWFANHRIFELYRPTLANTAAVDALTAQAEAAASGQPRSPAPAVAPAAVSDFVSGIEEAKLKDERRTQADNVNEYRETDKGYGSSTVAKPAASPAAPPVHFSDDFVSK